MTSRDRSAGASFLMFLLLSLSSLSLAGIPAGYYDDAQGLSGESLQAALHDIIDDHTSISYDDLWQAFYTTDDKPNGKVWDMYSDIPGGTPPYEYTFFEDEGGSASGEGEGYNREHTWPQSWFGGSVPPMYTDLFQIVPTDIYVNNRRNNYAYGEVGSPTWTSMNGSRLGPCIWPGFSGTAFEPRDEYKGDLARNFFYMATRYYGEDSSWPGGPMSDGAELLDWAVDMLLAWHQQDPVSSKEISRNDTVYGFQDNRNPFIDHPEYAGLIYDPTGIAGGLPPVAAISVSALPNPFSAVATVRFELPEDGAVHLSVYDMRGATVTTLHDGAFLPAGSHESFWNGRDGAGALLPSGVYVLRLSTSSASSVCSVLLLR
jgi:endonuclease I